MEPNEAELLTAVKAGDTERVKELLGTQPELRDLVNDGGTSAVLFAVYHGHPEIVSQFVAAGHQLDIFEAAAVGDCDRVRELADQANATSADGFQPLGLACFFGHESVAEFLFEAGADVHTPSRNPMRVQPIHAAAARRSAALVNFLLRRGADPNARQHLGYTPLHAAAQNGDASTVDALLAAGADPKLRTDEGRTAADYATTAGHTEIVKRLQ